MIGSLKSHVRLWTCETVPSYLHVCLQVVGLYRLCGSAAVKKELREAFERDSHAVELCENMYPDVNVITGNMKVLHYFWTQCLFCTLSSLHKQPLMISASVGYYAIRRVHKSSVLPMTVSEQVGPNKSSNDRPQLMIVFSINHMVQK